MKKVLSLAATVSMCSYAMAENAALPDIPFYDHTLSIEERLDDITARLTPEEKGHMITLWNKGVPRYGLKAFMPGEALHGLASPRNNAATVFPQSIGMAATFDPEAMKRMGDAVSDEARAQYHNGPVISRGQRGPLTFWSRSSILPVTRAGDEPRKLTVKTLLLMA